MRYNIPQFIERESKITSFVSFKQFIYLTAAGLISIAFYIGFGVGVGIIVFLITETIAGALAFGTVEGLKLPRVIKNFIQYKFSSNVYLWKKKEVPFRAFKKMEGKRKDEKDKEDKNGKESKLKVAGKSKLRKLKTNVEVK